MVIHSRKLVITALVFSFVVIIAACSSSAEPDLLPSPIPTPTIDVSPTSSTDDIETVAPLAPVFSVSTIDGENIRLENLLGTVPVYLLFIPSSTEEADRSQMSLIQSQRDEFEKLGAEVVVIVSDLPTRVIDMRDELGLEFALIADPLNVVADDWQVFDLDNEGNASPASFIFDAHGELMARLIAAEPADRPSVEEVLFVIEESLSVGAA